MLIITGSGPVRVDQGGGGAAGPDDAVEGRSHPEDAAGPVNVVMMIRNEAETDFQSVSTEQICTREASTSKEFNRFSIFITDSDNM